MEINIRDADFNDMDSLVALLGELFAIEADFGIDEKRQRSGLTRMLDGCGKHRCVKVAEVDETVVAMCTVQLLISTAEGGTVGLVEDMVVNSRFRGRGIARRLMADIETWARAHGATRLQLLADRTNIPALDFYHHLGWQPTRLICLRRK